MRKVSRVVFGVSMLAIGCAAGAASRFVVPPASAQQKANRWEYLCIEEWRGDRLQSKANAAGQEGWEIAVGVGEGSRAFVCFKRPVY